MSCEVRRPIGQNYLQFVLTFERIMKSLPKEVVTCSACGAEVVIRKNPILQPNHNFALPFDKAEFMGCDAPIDSVIEAIVSEGARQEFD